MKIRNDIPLNATFDSNGKLLTFNDGEGYWSVRTYDSNGNVLTVAVSDGYRSERTYAEDGTVLTLSEGYLKRKVYDNS